MRDASFGMVDFAKIAVTAENMGRVSASFSVG
jgi:hypothetical protein